MIKEFDHLKSYLIKFDSNWADEMNVCGFTTMDGEELEDIYNQIYNHNEYVEIYIGTNEYLRWNNGKQFLREFTIKEISNEDADVISKHLGYDYGFGDMLYRYASCAGIMDY